MRAGLGEGCAWLRMMTDVSGSSVSAGVKGKFVPVSVSVPREAGISSMAESEGRGGQT